MIWFPAHWAPQVIKELERREQDHRKRFPQWFDDRVPNKYWQQQQDARASRTLHFQKRPYLASPIQLLTKPQSGLIGSPCLFNAFWIECRNYDKA